MLNFIESIIRFFIKMYDEHHNTDYYEFNDYFTFEDINDLHDIAFNKNIPSGVYVYEKNPKEILLKEFDGDNILIGLSQELSTSMGNRYVAIDGGMMIKDDSKVISDSFIEDFLVNCDIRGFDRFVIVKTTCDRFINLINWYGLDKIYNIEPQKKRKYERKHKK